jgi:hypothetical protein
MITQGYQEVYRRFEAVREIGRDVVESAAANRCAMVVSGALRVRPGDGDLTFAQSPDLKPQFRGQEFLKRYFLKARATAEAIRKAYGPPDLVLAKSQFEALKGQPGGVVYLDNCWHTAREKVINYFINGTGAANIIPPAAATGDHIDLWTGSTLRIYADNPQAFRLVLQSEQAWYWRLS